MQSNPQIYYPNNIPQNKTINEHKNNSGKKTQKKKCKCIGRDAKIDSDLYFKIKEENDKLKKDRKIQEDKIKKLEVSLASIKENVIRERKQAYYKVINNANDKQEKEKIEKMNEYKNDINELILEEKEKQKIINTKEFSNYLNNKEYYNDRVLKDVNNNETEEEKNKKRNDLFYLR